MDPLLEPVKIDRARLRSDADLLAQTVLHLLDPRVMGAVQKVAALVGMKIDLVRSLSALGSETDELTDSEWSAALGFVEREIGLIRRPSTQPSYVTADEQAALSKLRSLIARRHP